CSQSGSTGSSARNRSRPSEPLRMSPSARVVTNARTRGGAGHSGTITSPAMTQMLQQRSHVGGKRRAPLHPLAGSWVNELELRGMQRLARKGGRMARAAPVDRVADQRVADELEMNANLVGAAGL